MQETRVRPLGWEDPLEKEMAAHSSILAWKIPWAEEAGGLQPLGSQRVRHDSTERILNASTVVPGRFCVGSLSRPAFSDPFRGTS